MTWIETTLVDVFKQLRIGATTVAATAAGLFTMATGRGDRAPVTLEPGDAAPGFTLMGSDGQTHRLADSHGREAVVVAWFPKAFTGGCTKECESIGRSRRQLDCFAAQVFGASADRPETNKRFAASMGVGFPILSDPGGAVARAYGVLGSSGFPRRWTFYIGADGRILDIDKRVETASHGDTIAARLEQLGVSRR
ncbi:MAG TPA: redoxin domain-containing protein [Vicinamibacterales bacterium]|jgi:peroxiredoxin Q/BCP|nr:redoxin domain-containing protein [Vicinamibacterales bacterium]